MKKKKMGGKAYDGLFATASDVALDHLNSDNGGKKDAPKSRDKTGKKKMREGVSD